MSLLSKRPLWVLFILAGAAVVAEAGVMALLAGAVGLTGQAVAFVDAGFLGLVLVPLAYFLVVRPSRSQVQDLREEVERREAVERGLEKKNTLNRLLIDSLPHPAWLLSRSREILIQNRVASDLGSVEGGFCWQSIHGLAGGPPSNQRCALCRADEAFENNETKCAEIEFEGRTWDAFWVPVDAEAGTYLHYFVDVTLHKRAEEDQRRAREEAEAASRAKTGFLATMSHEIRTPMNGVIGMLELALETDLNPEQREYVGLARSSADALMRVINDVLSFSKAEAGKLELEVEPFQLDELLAQVARVSVLRARERGLKLRLEAEPGLPAARIGDAGRLRQVLLNLTDNAVKFTEKGEIVVGVQRDPEGAPGSTSLRFWVADTGIGIRADKVDRLFKSFSQVDDSSTRRYAGTGLGLAISKQIVEQMGGRVWVESQPGRGSTFGFTLALPTVPESAAAAIAEEATPVGDAEPPASRSLKVLLAEDNPVNQRLVTLLLERRGHRVTVTASGVAALEALRTEAFDVVLMDVQMPEMDGLEATRVLRNEEGARRVPVIGLTALATPEDREACLAAGMDEYLAKPLRAATLFETLERLLAGKDEAKGVQL